MSLLPFSRLVSSRSFLSFPSPSVPILLNARVPLYGGGVAATSRLLDFKFASSKQLGGDVLEEITACTCLQSGIFFNQVEEKDPFYNFLKLHRTSGRDFLMGLYR
jgi:hypothetical protein